MFRVIPWCAKCDKKVDDFERHDISFEHVIVEAYCHGRRDSTVVLEYADPGQEIPDLSKLYLFGEPQKTLAPDSDS